MIILRNVRMGARKVRKRTREKYKRKEKFLINKYEAKKPSGVEELNKVDQSKYGGCNIFNDECMEGSGCEGTKCGE